MKTFNNFDVLPSSWYAVMPSRRLKPKHVRKIQLLDRHVAVFRGKNNQVYALDSRCPHLGADLSRGCVKGNSLQCEFHNWVFNGQGQCQQIPYMATIPSSAKTFAYPVEERYGFIWLFNGPRPTFPIPYFENWKEEELTPVVLPKMTFRCHPHIAVCNGLDVEHMRSLHNMTFVETPVLKELDAFRIQLKYRLAFMDNTPGDIVVRKLLGKSFTLNFMTWGGNMALGEVPHRRFPVLMIFNHTPLLGGQTLCQPFLLLPKRNGFWSEGLNYLKLPLMLFIINHFLIDDVDLFNTIQFWARLVEKDEPLRLFIQQVNSMPGFDARQAANSAV